MSLKLIIKENKYLLPIWNFARFILKRQYPVFVSPSYFLNNSKGLYSVCFIFAGYKDFTWEIVFKRIKKFAPKDIDICIVSSGVFVERLKIIAERNNWSYLAIKRNCVTLALNSAIHNFSFAQYIYKIDEDVFITNGFFEKLKIVHECAKKDYTPCFTAPLIPVNGFGYKRILEHLDLIDVYTSLFGYPVFSADMKMPVLDNPKVAKFFWGEKGFIPQIDDLNYQFEKSEADQNKDANKRKILYSVCPIRFSIGAILFERSMLLKLGFFPVQGGNGMGLDETFLCTQATTHSKAIVVAENTVVGHLSFDRQNDEMKDYFLKNAHLFDIKDV